MMLNPHSEGRPTQEHGIGFNRILLLLVDEPHVIQHTLPAIEKDEDPLRNDRFYIDSMSFL